MKIDIDALFDEYLNEFIENNGNVLSATDIEKKIADLYVEFGNEPCEALGGLTPIEYFNSLPTVELLTLFKELLIQTLSSYSNIITKGFGILLCIILDILSTLSSFFRLIFIYPIAL